MKKLGVITCLALFYACQSPSPSQSSLGDREGFHRDGGYYGDNGYYGDEGYYGDGNGYYDENGNYHEGNPREQRRREREENRGWW